MKKILLATAALIVITTTASAADLRPRTYTKAPPPPPAPIYNWTGFYIGGHIGGAFNTGNNPFFGNSDGQFIGGGQIGADYQFAPNWVAGIEANYSFLTGNSTLNRGLGSVTGRLGYAFGPALVYAKGGYAWSDTRNNFGFGQANRDGYTVGAGIEYLFAQNWSAKVEYQYYDYGRVNFITLPPLPVAAGSFRNDEHTVKVGLNYRFNFGPGSTF